MSTKLADKYGLWALVTGASQGIGYGFAERCAQEGFNIVMIARREDLLLESARSISEQYGVETRCLALDLTDSQAPESVKDFCQDLEIGMLVNNAAFSFPGEFIDISDRVIDKQVNINITLVAKLSRHFANQMKTRGRGAIINVSSRTGEIAMPYFAMYCAAKAFISTLSESLWFELKDSGVDVLVIKPDQTATEGYLSKNPNIMEDIGVQTVEDCVNESFDALGTYAAWLTSPQSRIDVKNLRAMPLEDAISINGTNMKSVFAQQLGGK